MAVGTAAWGWFNFLATPSELPDVVLKFVDWDIPTERAFWTMGILLPAQFAGLELSRATLGNKGRAGHPQFSLWQALEWMTATAMFLGAVHYISEAVDYVTVVFRFNPIQWRMGIEATSTAVSFATLLAGSRQEIASSPMHCPAPDNLHRNGDARLVSRMAKMGRFAPAHLRGSVALSLTPCCTACGVSPDLELAFSAIEG